MKFRRLIAVTALAVGALTFTSTNPSEAHTQPWDSSPGMEHNLCTWFRPYSVGYVYWHYRYSGTSRVCYVKIDWCYRYNIFLQGKSWSGPHQVQQVACPVPA